jgi:hypothetical protein
MTVTDTGAGMSEETLARIFEPFYTTKKVGEGTGLGMAMVYGLTEQMHGRVTVRSQPGEGTSVSIHVPLATAAATLMPTTPRGDATPSARRETLLLVEDDDAIRLLASRVLQRAGYRITEAVDGESAAHCMREQMERGGAIRHRGLGYCHAARRRRTRARSGPRLHAHHSAALGDRLSGLWHRR